MNIYSVQTYLPHSCDNCKIPSFTHHLKEVEMKINYACPFLREITEIIKKIKSLFGFGGCCLIIIIIIIIINHHQSSFDPVLSP